MTSLREVYIDIEIEFWSKWRSFKRKKTHFAAISSETQAIKSLLSQFEVTDKWILVLVLYRIYMLRTVKWHKLLKKQQIVNEIWHLNDQELPGYTCYWLERLLVFVIMMLDVTNVAEVKLWQKNKWEPGMTDNSDRDVNGEQRHNYVFVHLICQILKSCSVSLLIPHSVVIIVVL